MRGKKYQIGWTGNIEISTTSNMEGSSIETFSVSHDIWEGGMGRSTLKKLWKSPTFSCTAVAMGDEMDFMFLSLPLGGFQKQLSGFFPLRGFPLSHKNEGLDLWAHLVWRDALVCIWSPVGAWAAVYFFPPGATNSNRLLSLGTLKNTEILPKRFLPQVYQISSQTTYNQI